MAQPKLPPLSVRVPADLLVEVEAWAERAGMKRNGAVIELLRRGLAASGSGLPTPAAQAQIKAAAERAKPLASKPAPVWRGGHPKPGKSK